MVPLAHIVHQLTDRLRLRVAEKKGDAPFFQKLERALQQRFSFQGVSTNAATGSVLMVDPSIDVTALEEFGKENEFFQLHQAPRSPKPLRRIISEPVQAANRVVGQITDENLDLPSAIFLALLGFGAVQLFRGNLRLPPWYTAFWYAFGVFSKSIGDEFQDLEIGIDE